MAAVNRDANISWVRASTAFPNATLFGATGVNSEDVSQGAIGNCWFMASCAALSYWPDSIENLFLNKENA